MTKLIPGFILFAFIVSCSTYKTAERHLDRKMTKSDLVKSEWINDENNDTIEYWDNHALDKPVLVLLHGFGASTKYQYSKQVGALSEDYRLILPNLYYFGETRPGSEKYSVGDQVDLVNNLIHHLKVDSFSLIGVSYGGLISIELAQKRKEAVQKLVLFDAPIKFMDDNDVTFVQDYFDVPSIEELFVPSEPLGLRKLMFLASGKKSRVPVSMLKEFHQKAYLNTLKEKRSLIKRMIGSLQEYQQREYEFGFPILLIWGEKDMVVPIEKGKLLQAYLGSKCEFHVIENAAHMPNMTNAKEFNRLVMSFFESVD